ncbi:SMP-30/gluconolactonase/LRE family protein [Gordonia sp. CPCC 205333]|uniref:SMP-30/gluconolactonase/LRE family protein n=1 Tax=Gordonia sp. CPCC 205333 TaxID=3140790 RepID=UPI003AF3ED68
MKTPKLAIVAVLTFATISVLGATPPASAAPSCPSPDAGVLIRTGEPGLSWAENVGYDRDGNLWVSRSLRNVVERYDRSGRLTGSVAVESPGAIRLGPDGRMYVAAGDSPVNMIPGLPRTGRIMAFSPSLKHPRPRAFAIGLGMPNGLAFATDGAMYVADSNIGVVRIDPRGVIDKSWTARAPKNLSPNAVVNGTGMNGIVIIDEIAYVTLTSSLTGRILRIPLRHPNAVGVAVDLTGPLPGVVDDLAALDDHTVAAATTTGQVIVADLRTGRRCTVSLGEPLTSVAVVPARSRTLVIGTESGNIRLVRL